MCKEGKRRLHQADGFPQSKLDMAKARLPEPQESNGSQLNRVRTMVTLTLSWIGERLVAVLLSPPKGRILTYQGQRLERGAYVERIWMND